MCVCVCVCFVFLISFSCFVCFLFVCFFGWGERLMCFLNNNLVILDI